MENKYKDSEEFISAFKKDPASKQIVELIRSKKIPDITKEKLKDWNIRPICNNNNELPTHRNAQFIEIRKNVVEEYKRIYGGVLTAPTEKIKKFNFMLNAPENVYEIQRLLLLTLSDKFQKEIKKIRKKYKIPSDGFKSIDSSDKEFGKWKFRRNPFFKQIEKDSTRLFQKHKLEVIDFLGPTLIVSESDFKRLLLFKKAYFPEEHFIPQSCFADAGDPSPLEYAYLIAITRPIENKKQLQDFIDKSWTQIKKDTKKHFNWVTINQEFRRDYLIYQYYKSGKTYEQIKDLLKFEYSKYRSKDFNKSQIKQTIIRIKRRIRGLEGVTQD
jgi:hypothetical protein